MNFQRKPIIALLSGMMVTSLALLAADTAWSEATKPGAVKKATAQKAKPRATTQSKRPIARPAAPKPSTPKSTGQATNVAAPTQATQATQTALTMQATQAVMPPAVPFPSPGSDPQALGNPYLPVPQPTPWSAQTAKTTTPLNPYLAHLQAPPTEAPTPWSALPAQMPRYSPPTWINPFQGFRYPFPAAPTPFPAPPPAAQSASPAPQASTNPYLAYRLPIIPPTPWTPPAVQIPRFPPPAWGNPYAPSAAVAAATPAPAAAQPAAPLPPWWNNPYLTHLRPASSAQAPQQAEAVKPAAWPTYTAPIVPFKAQIPQFVETAKLPFAPTESVTPPPASTPANPPQQTAPILPAQAPPPTAEAADNKPTDNLLEKLKYAILPNPPPSGQAILPTIKTVYPTGEKPLKVLTFKCPTELVGVTPPPTAALHEVVNLAFDGINKTNLLPFNMQQVCQ